MKAVNNKLEGVELMGTKVINWLPFYDYFELQGKKVVYTYVLPENEIGTLSGDPDRYNYCPTREDAVERLKNELQSLKETKKLLQKILDALEKGAKYETSCENGEDDED